MRLLPPDSDVDLYKVGFGESDRLNRKSTGAKLSTLLEQISDPLVVALDGGWGTGKSYFLKRWVGAHRIENGGKAKTIYFDAFAHDFLEDPLIALTGVIGDNLDQTHSKLSWNGVKTAVAKVAAPLARIGAAVVTAGLTEVAGPLMDVAIAKGADETDRLTKEFWNKEHNRRAAMNQVRHNLTQMVNAAESPGLIVVVDELDRCRPDFALGLLETIKHFFSVPKVHFVLGVNLSALEHSVRSRYGSRFDAREYLQRFYSVSFGLPEVAGPHGQDDIGNLYFSDTAVQMGIPPRTKEAFQYLLKLRHRVARVSLRQQSRILTQIALTPSNPGIETKNEGYLLIAASLVLFHQIAPVLYAKAKSMTLSHAEIMHFFGVDAEGYDIAEREASTYDNEAYSVAGLWHFIISGGTRPENEVQKFARILGVSGKQDDVRGLPQRLARDLLEAFTLNS